MLLAIDTSSLVLSCAVCEEDKLVAEWTVQRRLTHSEQLIPHMDGMLREAGIDKKDITAVACAKMAARIWNVPLIAVDTLEGLAWNMAGADAFILPLEDAQRGNVYAALYGAFSHMWQEAPAEAAPVDEVIAAAVRHGGTIIAVGEGADMYREKLLAAGIRLAPPQNRCCRAGSVAMAAWAKWKRGETADPMTLVPNYIRRSEAEVLWEQRHPEK